VTEERGFIEVKDLVVNYGSVTAVRGVSFTVEQAEHLTLLGPSGCGKTTILRAIAGLETPSSGEIWVGGRPVYSSARKVNLPPEQRGLSMVFQSYAIWPHMTVAENVAYGLKLRKVAPDKVRHVVHEVLSMVRLDGLGDRNAAKLSGGQQQRVALARSIAFEPSALLLDEPLSNLDAKLRAEMRLELRELQRRVNVTSIYVTHDQEEALAISDRVIVMNAGSIEQVGPPLEIYERPRTRFVANFVGASNIIIGRVDSTSQDGNVRVVTAQGAAIDCAGPLTAPAGEVAVSVRAVYPRLSRERPDDPSNVWPGQVRRRVFLGDFVQYLVDWAGGTWSIRQLPYADFQEADQVFVHVDPQHCVFVQ
jgi:ABC-type Fe3+/spermidine/putrescine transport system ATPase subunit